MFNIIYKEKYNKYKNKYLKLKGGAALEIPLETEKELEIPLETKKEIYKCFLVQCSSNLYYKEL